MAWAAALALGDTMGARRWRTRMAGTSHSDFMQKLVLIPLVSTQAALPLADGRWANTTLRQEGTTAQERGAAQLGEYAIALAEGRAVDSWDGFMGNRTPWDEAGLVRQAMVKPQYRPQSLARLAQMDSAAWPPLRDCFAEILRVTSGDTSGTRGAIQRQRAFAALDPAPIPPEQWGSLDFRVCPLLLETLLEGGRDRSGASKLEALDSLMRGGPRWLTLGPPAAPVVEANWTIARLREARGISPEPLRPSGGGRTIGTLPIFGLCRRSCAGGPARGPGRRHRRGALGIRPLPDAADHPDPAFVPQRDSVLAECSALGDR